MRIMIVEDEQGIAAFLKQGLKEESFAVDAVRIERYPLGRRHSFC
jgi:DNA-binding response OmpR family regulator